MGVNYTKQMNMQFDDNIIVAILYSNMSYNVWQWKFVIPQ